MRISELRGEAVIDVIADIIEPVSNIAQDDEIKALFKREQVAEDVDKRALAIERLKKHVPKIIKNHKGDVISILAIINGEDVNEYKKNLSIGTLIRDVTDIFNDPDLVGFFISQVPSEETEDTESESTSTNGDTRLEVV